MTLSIAVIFIFALLGKANGKIYELIGEPKYDFRTINYRSFSKEEKCLDKSCRQEDNHCISKFSSDPFSCDVTGEPKYNFGGMRNYSFTSSNKIECFEYYCKEKDNCIVSFSNQSCVHYKFETTGAQMILWNPGAFLNGTKFVTLVKISGTDLPEPKVLWLFNEQFKGQNLGSVGRALDMPTKGLQWIADGPRVGLTPPDERNKAKFGVNKPPFNIANHNVVDLVQKGKRLLSFTSGFTVALWLRTDENRSMIIFDEDANREKNKGLDLWFYPDSSRLDMNGNGNDDKVIFTTANDANINKWRHVAVTQMGRNKTKFYLNGEDWSISPDSKIESMEIMDPEKLFMWTSAYERSPNNFAGAMACLMIFEEPLSISQIRKIKRTCP